MQRILKVLLSIFLLATLILQPTGTTQANTSGKITSHGGIVVEYNISGGTITKKTKTDNPNWGEQLKGTVRVGETLTVSVTGSTNSVKVEGIESDPRESGFYYSASYDGIETDRKQFDFPPVGSGSHTSSIKVTEKMKQVNFYCTTTIRSFASGELFSQSVRFHASFDVVKDDPPSEDIPVEKVTITNCPGNVELMAGTSAKLNAAVAPDNATDKKVNWSVDNPAVASISAKGTLTAKTPGTVTVTATSAENSKIKDQCTIKVVAEVAGTPDKPKPDPDPPKPAPEVTLTITNCPGQLGLGAKGQLRTAVNPAKAPNGRDWRIGWFVDNNSVLTVDDEGRYVARKPGQVTITAYLYDRPMVQATCRVVVSKEQVAPKPPDQDPPKADTAHPPPKPDEQPKPSDSDPQPPEQPKPPESPKPQDDQTVAPPPADSPKPPASDSSPPDSQDPPSSKERRTIPEGLTPAEWYEEFTGRPLRKGPVEEAGVSFSNFKGEVGVICGHTGEWRFAEMGMTLKRGDIVTTGEGSEAVLGFSDMTSFTLRPDSEVILDSPPGNDCKLRLITGKIWVEVKKMITEGEMEVTMNQAVTGVRGTIFELEETGQESIVQVHDGTVEVIQTSTGVKDLISAGHMAVVTDKDFTISSLSPAESSTPWALYFLIPTFLAALGFFGVMLYRSRMVPATPPVAIEPFIEIITIGRDPGNSYIIDDPNVSRVHAQIEYNSGQYLLTDFDSTNGTMVNGNPVKGTVELKPASEVSFGDSSFYFDGKNLLPNK